MSSSRYILVCWILTCLCGVFCQIEEEEQCSSFGTVKILLKGGDKPLREFNATYKNHTYPLRFKPDDLLYMGENSLLTSTYGRLIHLYTIDKSGFANPRACDDSIHENMTQIPDEDWIAMIQRGSCAFDQKIQKAVEAGAGAVLVYNSEDSMLQPMSHGTFDAVTIMVSEKLGYDLILMTMETEVYVNVSYEKKKCSGDDDRPSNLSVMIVAISFVVMMMISLTWLVFYYIQRHRNLMKTTRHGEKLERAMRKALQRIGVTNLSPDDIGGSIEHADCTYCLEGFCVGETIRALPCRHRFHKDCVDPWLIKNRTCPNCKENVLIALGVKVKGITDLTVAEEAADSTELQQLNPDGTVVSPQSDDYFAGSQLLTDGQNMFLYVPNDSNDRLHPFEEVHLEIDTDEPVSNPEA